MKQIPEHHYDLRADKNVLDECQMIDRMLARMTLTKGDRRVLEERKAMLLRPRRIIMI